MRVCGAAQGPCPLNARPQHTGNAAACHVSIPVLRAVLRALRASVVSSVRFPHVANGSRPKVAWRLSPTFTTSPIPMKHEIIELPP
jgi:hypothetical protein